MFSLCQIFLKSRGCSLPFYDYSQTASKLSRAMEDAPKDTWDSFGVAKNHCNEISNQIMDLYEEGDL